MPLVLGQGSLSMLRGMDPPGPAPPQLSRVWLWLARLRAPSPAPALGDGVEWGFRGGLWLSHSLAGSLLPSLSGGVCVAYHPGWRAQCSDGSFKVSVALVALSFLEISLVDSPHSSWGGGWAQSVSGVVFLKCKLRASGEEGPAMAHMVSTISGHLHV